MLGLLSLSSSASHRARRKGAASFSVRSFRLLSVLADSLRGMINHRVAISGSWRLDSPAVERDVRRTVSRVIEEGGGIVTGGALGVDSVATDEVLTRDFLPEQLQVIIPTSLQVYSAHYRKRATEGVITAEQAEMLIEQLEEVKQRGTLVELGFSTVDKNTYYARNTAVLDAATSLAAFQVNQSPGTQDTIDKAWLRGMPVVHYEYRF